MTWLSGPCYAPPDLAPPEYDLRPATRVMTTDPLAETDAPIGLSDGPAVPDDQYGLAGEPPRPLKGWLPSR